MLRTARYVTSRLASGALGKIASTFWAPILIQGPFLLLPSTKTSVITICSLEFTPTLKLVLRGVISASGGFGPVSLSGPHLIRSHDTRSSIVDCLDWTQYFSGGTFDYSVVFLPHSEYPVSTRDRISVTSTLTINQRGGFRRSSDPSCSRFHRRRSPSIPFPSSDRFPNSRTPSLPQVVRLSPTGHSPLCSAQQSHGNSHSMPRSLDRSNFTMT